MFVGHLAVAFAAKRASPRTSVGWFVAAGTALDLVWPILVLLGVEQVSIRAGATAVSPLVFDAYPWSHSLVMSVAWGGALAAFARWRGVDGRSAGLIGALVVSHWVLDFVTHAPDMPLWPGSSPQLGLGLWHSIPGTLAIEGAMWLAGLWLFLAGRRRRNWRGPVALWSLVAVCSVMWAAGPWAPPPPNAKVLGWFALIGWVIIPWAAWADRNYLGRGTAAPAIGRSS